jgi:hypothetical protein
MMVAARVQLLAAQAILIGLGVVIICAWKHSLQDLPARSLAKAASLDFTLEIANGSPKRSPPPIALLNGC